MWILRKSRGGFVQLHRGSPLPETAAGIELLGAHTPDGERANFTLLEQVMQSIWVQSTSGGKRSADIYCGLVPSEDGLAGSKSTQKGAWITIGEHCVDLAVLLASTAQVFGPLSGWLLAHGPEKAQAGIEGARGSMFRFVGSGFPGQHHTYEDDSDVWGSSLDSEAARLDAVSMIRWVVGHEITHLLQGDDVGEPDTQLRSARAVECVRILGPIWPASSSHQRELIADYGAVQYLGNSAADADELFQLIRGSLLATLAVCFESWFIDESAVSESHPSPFLREEALLGMWLDFLHRQKQQDNPVLADWDDLALDRVVDAYIMTSWVAGCYGSHRDGVAGLIADRDLVERLLKTVLAQ